MRTPSVITAAILLVTAPICAQVTAPPSETSYTPWHQCATPGLLRGRSTNSAVWTGRELIVFGGEGMNVSFGDGAVYNFARNQWRALPSLNEPTERTDHSGVWTGREMLIWGGFGGSYGNNTNRNDGARYSPVTKTWHPISKDGAPSARFAHSAVWTGTEMLIWGGYTDSHAFYSGCHADAHLNTGGCYYPAGDFWTDISTLDAPTRRLANAVVWTGSEMIIWGGQNTTGELGDGARYCPSTNTWKPMSSINAPSPRQWPVAVWTGKEMIVWSGTRNNVSLGDGARYDPKKDEWTTMSLVNALKGRTQTKGFWTGKEMIVWGGINDNDANSLSDVTRYVDTGATYNPATDAWTPMVKNGGPSGRLASQVWTGKGLLIFGGYNNVHLNDTWFYSLQKKR